MLADRLALNAFRLAFFLPLLVCTWLALVPEPPDPVFRLGDVILHGAAFAYLTMAFVLMMMARAEPVLDRRLVGTAALAMFGYGVFLAAVQSFIPERTAEIKDLGVDLLGIGVGLLIAALLARPLIQFVRFLSRGLLGAR